MRTVFLLALVAVPALGFVFLNPRTTTQAPRTTPGSPAAVVQNTVRTAVDAPSATRRLTSNGDIAMEIVNEASLNAGGVPPAAVVSTGPWGTLQSLQVYIAAPDHILELFSLPSSVTAWNFVGMDDEQVAALLGRPGIPEDLRKDLLDRSRWTAQGDAVQVTPSHAALVGLPPAARAAIYQVLKRSEANEFQYAPYFVPDGDVDAWIGHAGLRPELVDAVRRTVYPAGKASCFSDVSLLMSLTQSHDEARLVLKALSRTRTALLRLRLDDSDDLAKIRSYWSGGKANAKDFLPLLESIATNPMVEYLDIIHVLPPYARKLMYTYPHASLAIGGRYPDCHWTSLNFFNYRPEGRLFDTVGATMFVRENFMRGEPPYAYGDVLFFTDAAGNAIHSCVYLADDFVFTKNGANLISPWIIMKRQEVIDRYSVVEEPTIRIYRKAR